MKEGSEWENPHFWIGAALGRALAVHSGQSLLRPWGSHTPPSASSE